MKKENDTSIVKKSSQSKMIAGAAALTAIIAVAGIAASTYAYRGDFQDRRPNFDSEKHASLLEAFENNDYDAWLELSGDRPVVDKITEENFSRFVEMHNLMKDGDFEGAKEIRDELGLEGMGKRGWNRPGMIKFNEEARTALDNNDYDAWLEAIPEVCPARDLITEENFSKLIEAHNLMKDGDFEGAKEIREELGFKVMPRNGMHRFNR